ncbi:MAG TPA: hypothetical protein VM869_36805 [Enhygromyxa sp.]|nr:hypothetical protein [Enhygromyxa sp.]
MLSTNASVSPPGAVVAGQAAPDRAADLAADPAQQQERHDHRVDPQLAADPLEPGEEVQRDHERLLDRAHRPGRLPGVRAGQREGQPGHEVHEDRRGVHPIREAAGEEHHADDHGQQRALVELAVDHDAEQQAEHHAGADLHSEGLRRAQQRAQVEDRRVLDQREQDAEREHRQRAHAIGRGHAERRRRAASAEQACEHADRPAVAAERDHAREQQRGRPRVIGLDVVAERPRAEHRQPDHRQRRERGDRQRGGPRSTHAHVSTLVLAELEPGQHAQRAGAEQQHRPDVARELDVEDPEHRAEHHAEQHILDAACEAVAPRQLLDREVGDHVAHADRGQEHDDAREGLVAESGRQRRAWPQAQHHCERADPPRRRGTGALTRDRAHRVRR